MLGRMSTRGRKQELVHRAFYSVKRFAELMDVSYETALSWVKQDRVPAMLSPGGRMYFIPAYWIADCLAQSVEHCGPPASGAGIEALRAFGVSDDALEAAVQTWMQREADATPAPDTIGAAEPPPDAEPVSTAPIREGD